MAFEVSILTRYQFDEMQSETPYPDLTMDGHATPDSSLMKESISFLQTKALHPDWMARVDRDYIRYLIDLFCLLNLKMSYHRKNEAQLS